MINICKECGEPFEASSARIKYCSKVHYRPCPICGTLVEAKYLSDPPRKCDNCKGKKVSTPAKIVPEKAAKVIEPDKADPKIKHEFSANVEDVREYIGPPVSVGFIPGHKYAVEVDKKEGLYWVTASRDVTEDKVIDLVITYASQISIDRRFKKV